MTEKSELDRLKQQIDDLQSQLAFQEDTLQLLNDIVTRQQRQIENLHEQYHGQKNQLDALSHEISSDSPIERPPHY
ncbi:MAG: SlyX family protein [Spongiibacteraceae bacterium]